VPQTLQNMSWRHRVRNVTDLQNMTPILQVQREVAVLAEYTGYSAACCAAVADSDGAAALLRLVRGANRSVPHVAFTRGALATLRNLARRPSTAAAVLAAPACPQILGEQLQLFRDQRVRAVSFGQALRVQLTTKVVFG